MLIEYAPSSLCFELNAVEKPTNNRVASIFLTRISLTIRWIIKICKIVDCFLLNSKRRRYHTEIMTGADYTYDPSLPTNTSAQSRPLLHSLEQAARGISYKKKDKRELMFFKQDGAISLSSEILKLVYQLIFLDNKITPTEIDVNLNKEIRWTAVERLWIMWKSDLTYKIK